MSVCDARGCLRDAQAAHDPCCSSSFHGRSLCCEHYCRSHFVEVGQCSPQQHAADELAAIWPTRTADDGTRETWDPVAGVWRNDADLVAQHDARTAKRRLLGESWADGDPNARAMNEAGL